MGIITNPRQTVIVTCRSRAEIIGKESEKDNAITIDWHMPVSFNPQLYAIAVGKSRFSKKLISDSRAFVVNFIGKEMEKYALYCGRHTGEHRDKLKEGSIKTREAENVDCPVLENAVAVLECEVINEIDAGDHAVFIGKVVHGELFSDEKRLFHADGDRFTTTM